MSRLTPNTSTILLVEDNAANRYLAQIFLEQEGHKVFLAENGLHALTRLQEKKHFDLIFMDIQMPEMDGLSATRVIRACETDRLPEEKIDESLLQDLQTILSGNHIPIIAMTANTHSWGREQCIAVGMDDFISKPFMPEDVTFAIRNVLNTSRQSLSAVAIENLQKMYHLQPEQIEKLLQVSIASLVESLTTAEQALDGSRFADFQSAAHKIHGTLLGLGLRAEAELSKEMENDLRLNTTKDYHVSLKNLKRNIQSLLQE